LSFGKMAEIYTLLSNIPVKDADGFTVQNENILATGRTYFEPRNSTEKWRNNAVFSDATALFRFRVIPNLTVDTTMTIICNGERYNILSAENVKNKNMYIEVIAKQISSSEG